MGKHRDPEYKKKWRAANRDRVLAQARAWRQRNKERCLLYGRRYMWKKRGQPEPPRLCPIACEVCGNQQNSRSLCLDHNHLTGEFRGWLCDACNTVLGKVKDSPSRLRALADYLERKL